jgi:branched-chain amino acid transport system substrate-binding protein
MQGRFLVVLAMVGLMAGCGGDNKSKDKIVIGQATSLTGPFASTAVLANRLHDLWIEEVNAAGGLYLDEYGKKLPIELIRYDDTSDVNLLVNLVEKLIVTDKVDLLLPPCSTDSLYNAAPVANNHGFVLLGGAGGALKLKEIMSGLPYFFSVLNFADTQMPALAAVLAEMGVKKAAVVFIQELHGIEYSGVATTEFALKGIDVAMLKSIPLNTTDFSALFAEAAADQADAFVAFAYPTETFAMIGQAQAMHMNFKALFASVGTSFPVPMRDTPAFGGPVGIEGIMGGGAWNSKVSAGAAAFENAYKARWGESPEYWGTLAGYSSMQFLQRAIETAGTLDQKKIRDVMVSSTFDTAMGPMHFENNYFRPFPGEIGQWQGGVFEVIDVGAKRTAPPLYPKPAW